ncbi:hypothetical protein [Bifidobacterium pullorum]|uniref:hypothetical protein n=1 Tax=Bifidobacterium pullorum TaxID=78448 RepID=UPI0024315495|nr:hypothetical protein [Bifidobacterium pullorum]
MRKTLALAATAIITLALAACGTAVRDYGGSAKADCINLGSLADGYTVYDCQTTLRDTRRVNCVVVDKSGIDCDWSHVDGADNL